MTLLYIFSFLVYGISLTIQTKSQDDYYIGAVVEYHTDWWFATLKQNIVFNAENYVDIISYASLLHKVDIIVFPENGLSNKDYLTYIAIPDPKDKIIPALTKNSDEVLKKISSAARVYKTYVVINIHEANNFKRYSTNVVFDRNGTVIARYRKYHVFGEILLNPTTKPEPVYFDTDFGVRFGTFTTFDILFKEPTLNLVRDYNITDIVFPTAWFSELPFWTSVQIQNSWSFANNVNLLAANHNDVFWGATGTGLYRRNKINPTYIVKDNYATSLIVGKMPKIGNSDKTLPNEDKIIPFRFSNPAKLYFKKEDFSIYSNELLPVDKNYINKTKIHPSKTNSSLVGHELTYLLKKKLCSKKFCCNFDIIMKSTFYKDGYNPPEQERNKNFNHFRYRLVAADGIKHLTYLLKKLNFGVQICGVVSCINENPTTCNQLPQNNDKNNVKMTFDDIGSSKLYSTKFLRIRVNGEFEAKNAFIEPNVLCSQFGNPDHYVRVTNPVYQTVLNGDKLNATIIFESDSLIAGGIYNRIFSRD